MRYAVARKGETSRFSVGFSYHALDCGASSDPLAKPFTDWSAFVIMHGAPGGGEAAAAVQSMGVLILALVGPQGDAVAAASIGFRSEG